MSKKDTNNNSIKSPKDEAVTVTEAEVDPEEAVISKLLTKPQKAKKPKTVDFDEELVERELERQKWQEDWD